MRSGLRVDISYERIKATRLKKESLVNSLLIFQSSLIFYSPAKFDNDGQAKNQSGKMRNLKTMLLAPAATFAYLSHNFNII